MVLKDDWWKSINVRWLGEEYQNIFDLPYCGLLPFHVFKQLLSPISSQSFVDLLNTPSASSLHVITVYEEIFRRYEKKHPNMPFFSKSEIFEKNSYNVMPDTYIELDNGDTYPFLMEIEDFIAWSKRNLAFISELKSLELTYQEKNHIHDDLESKNKQLKARIAELETELAACREQLEEARRANPSSNEGHGLCSLVIRMREEGKTEEEIAAFLNDNKTWCTGSQVGALLHRGGRVTADSMLKYGQRLLGKA